ncbi:MAG TPA: HAMP domain-containing protein, partial [Thiotrichales bacterium]|nr:HAMP domain-containing protein [Thiotrichales bacterium]
MKIFSTLYARLVLVIFLLFILVSSVFLLAALYSAHMYQQEASQRLNHDLAGYIVNEHVLIQQGEIQQNNLKQLFHEAMIINPSLELYLLDANGKVLAYSDVLKNVKSERVSLQPIQKLLSGNYTMPIMGDDPRYPDRQQVFTAAPVMSDNALQGYIYAVLGSDRVAHITQLLQQSYIMKWSIAAIAVALLFSFISGLALFYWLTRKLSRLSHSMQVFSEQNKLFEGEQLQQAVAAMQGDSDEIDRMTMTFEAMAARIQSQMTRLQETDSLRRELVANVSHDLRTPLSSLKGYIETLLLKDSELDEAERRRYLDIAHHHAERLSKLVIELFELAKLDANELKPDCEMFSLAELAHDVSQKFDLRAQENDIKLVIETDQNIPFVNADVGMI